MITDSVIAKIKKLRKEKQDKFDSLPITFTDDEMTLAKELAQIENDFYKGQVGLQGPTNEYSSLVGILGELAALNYLNNCEYFSEVNWSSGDERANMLKGFVVYADCDINCLHNRHKCKIEVKSARDGYENGMILTTHTKKYAKNNVDYVFFMLVMELRGEWKAKIYNLENPTEILKAPVENNDLGVPCHVVPEKN